MGRPESSFFGPGVMQPMTVPPVDWDEDAILRLREMGKKSLASPSSKAWNVASKRSSSSYVKTTLWITVSTHHCVRLSLGP